MKISRILLFLALCLPALKASASFFDVSGFGGYTTLAMGDVNTDLKNYASAKGYSYTAVQNGYYVGADALLTLFPFVKFGPRIEYVQGSTGSITGAGVSDNLSSDLLLYELGLSTQLDLPLTGLSLKAGVFAGYGEAGTELSTGGSAYGQAFSEYGLGGGFVGEAVVDVNYALFMGLSCGLDLGYRYAPINNDDVSSLSGSSGSGVNVGQPFLQNSNGNQASIDFSGYNIGVNLRYSI